MGFIRMRKYLVGALFMVLLSPLLAQAQGIARCGFSFGLAGQIGVPTDNALRAEFPYIAGAEGEVKYYLWKPFSLAAAFGFLYATGQPKDDEWHGKTISLDRAGTSYMRAGTGDVLARIEIGRYWKFNPYVGGGAGGMYNTMDWHGVRNRKSVSDSYDEWLLHYVGLVGLDYTFDKFVAVKVEARWTFAPSTDPFVEQSDIGNWLGVIGMQIYL